MNPPYKGCCARWPRVETRPSSGICRVMRPIWSGTISFGLVSVPVRMYPATESKELRFHFLHKKDLTPIAYEKVRRDDREPVDRDEIVRGFEIEKGPLRPARGRRPRPARHRAHALGRHLRLRRSRRHRSGLFPEGLLPAPGRRCGEALPPAGPSARGNGQGRDREGRHPQQAASRRRPAVQGRSAARDHVLRRRGTEARGT
jgi:Ku70/Ku80 beta-barrel domain